MKQFMMCLMIVVSTISTVPQSFCNAQQCKVNKNTLKRVRELEKQVNTFIELIHKSFNAKGQKLPNGQRAINLANRLFKELSCDANKVELSLLDVMFNSTSDMLQALAMVSHDIAMVSSEYIDWWKGQVFDALENKINMLHATIYEKKSILSLRDKINTYISNNLNTIEDRLDNMSELLDNYAEDSYQAIHTIGAETLSDIQTMQVLGLEDVYGALNDTYSENFVKYLNIITQDSVYNFLGLDKKSARNLSNDQINKLIGRLQKKEAEKTGKKVDNTAGVWRQIHYIFRGDLNKGLYDAYLLGRDIVKKIKLTEEQSKRLNDMMNRWLDLKQKLEELQDKFRYINN